MVQQLGPFLAFEPWTWGQQGIAGYQQRVIKEEQLYDSMKEHMTREEEQEYGELIQKSYVEKLEDTVTDTWHALWQSGKKVLGSKEIQMVPVPKENIRDPDHNSLVDLKGKPIVVRWAVSEIQDSYSAMYRAMSNPVDRTPGECSDRSREGGKPLKELGRTNEYIHPAVWWRYKTLKNEAGDMKYDSQAIRPKGKPGFTRQQDPKYGSWGYLKGNLWIPEWFVKPTNSYLGSNGYGQFEDADGDEPWEHAEWTYLDNVADKDELLGNLAQFYVEAQTAQKKMKADKKEFPFEVLS